MKLEDMKGMTYEERQAWPVIRTLIKRKPELIPHLLEGMTKEAAQAVLLQARDELNALMNMSRAFTAAAAALVKIDEKESEDEAT